VLAGTVRRTGDAAADARAADALRHSVKDLEEHEYAVRSLVQVLRAHCAEVSAPAAPSVLRLPNVLHLSTDVQASGCEEVSALELAGLLHPTAAVGRHPDPGRGRAHPRAGRHGPRPLHRAVGWVDARGDGEFGIALRCAQVQGRTVRLFAGCGIVAGSDPDDEVAEASAKFLPVRDALEG
jgi:menaquinone-specific isochorismate synthase